MPAAAPPSRRGRPQHVSPPPVIRHITLDSTDPYALAEFWSAFTGFAIEADVGPDEDEVLLEPPIPGHPGLLFIRVPEAKSVKNRLRFDVVPTAHTRDEEVARLLGLGATVADDRRSPDGRGWVVMADPQGNEFCVERSEAECGQAATP